MQMLEVQENSTTRNTIYYSNHACSQRMICISIRWHAPCSLHSQQARGLPPSGSGNLPSTHVWCKVERCLQARVDRAEGLQHGAHHGQLACTRSTREGVSIRMRQKQHCSTQCIAAATDYWCNMNIQLLHSSHDRHRATSMLPHHARALSRYSFVVQPKLAISPCRTPFSSPKATALTRRQALVHQMRLHGKALAVQGVLTGSVEVVLRRKGNQRALKPSVPGADKVWRNQHVPKPSVPGANTQSWRPACTHWCRTVSP